MGWFFSITRSVLSLIYIYISSSRSSLFNFSNRIKVKNILNKQDEIRILILNLPPVVIDKDKECDMICQGNFSVGVEVDDHNVLSPCTELIWPKMSGVIIGKMKSLIEDYSMELKCFRCSCDFFLVYSKKQVFFYRYRWFSGFGKLKHAFTQKGW